MKRLFYIFSAAALFVCYSGFCSEKLDSAFPFSTNMDKAGCHKMGHGVEKAESGMTGQKLNNEGEASTTPCCFDSLVNAQATDQMPQLWTIEVGQLDFTILNDKVLYSEVIQNRTPREHDPPDLQKLNSTFLL